MTNTADIKIHNEQQKISPASILCLGLGWFPQTPGGLERYIYELTQQLAANQDKINLCGIDLPNSQLYENINFINLATSNQSIWQRLHSVRSNFKKINTKNLDAINLHFALYSLPILDLLPPKIPITFNFHGPWADESHAEGNNKLGVFLKRFLIEKQVYQKCNRFIVLSQAFGKILHEQYQIPGDKIHVIPGGVNIEKFQPNFSPIEARQQLGWHEDRPIIFTSRRLVQRVGVDKLLTALSIIKPKIPDIWLAIAGRGNLQLALQNQAIELGLNNNVKFLGFLPDEHLPIAYQAADLTVIPSQSFEGFGLAIVESLACGTPVVCTPIGGMPEILTPFSPDLITSSISAEDIAAKLSQILLGEISKPSRESCRQYAVDKFNWYKIAQQIRHIILSDGVME
ncbi:glycosyltransferase family 4 protein [Calothrix rhizosoleniae]|uniref:glycosyltransferase family 4 protein n=1 Tax=Calothrix rhizosoleniae TaxID=888997 RepID=UPI000B4A0020|nr:glycosyltransferase family 4 protein [Calothrix rhizosoleniae]